MPICKREGFDLNQTEDKNVTFHDNDLVFCCYITKRIFREYENYFRHVMVINSTVWQCEATGRDNLTYEEALKSERVARKKMEQFKHSLRAPVMLVIEHARQSAVKTLNIIVSKFLRKRYFLNEEVTLVYKKNTTYVVVGIKPPKNAAEPANGVYEDTDVLEYRLRELKGDASTEIVVKFDQIRRQRMEFTIENLQMFIKNNVTRVDGILRPKPEAYKQLVTEPKITFASIFIGKMPRYSPAKIKRPDLKDTKKQSTLNNFLVKETEELKKASEKSKQQKEEKAKAKAKSLQEQMERVRIEKQERVAELERQRAEKRAQLLERVETEMNQLLTKTDDLERSDQKLLPLYRPVRTLLPDKLLGDAFMMREFLHCYAGLLSGIEVFRSNLSFYEMTRALTVREIAGPLSDILLILLGTVFDLQKEEEEDCRVTYIQHQHLEHEPLRTMGYASRTHVYAKRHFQFKVNELPLDALTLSEVLRLHLLGSGAMVTDKPEKWRGMYRNGYTSREDPGLELRMQHSHILRALKNYPIYQFSFRDIMRVIRCLMSQILTYSGTIHLIDERMEQTAKARIEIRAQLAAENRRLAAIDQLKRTLTNEHHQQCLTDELKNDEAKKQALGDKLNRRIAELLAQSDRERRKHETNLLGLRSQLFNFLTYLGMDRGYRRYFVLESISGIFVEHAPDSFDTCLAQPPQNKSLTSVHNLEQLPRNRKDLRTYLLKLYGDEDRRRKPGKQSLENKENQEHHLNGLVKQLTNGQAAVEEMEVDVPAADAAGEQQESEATPTQQQLFMCSGDRRNCIVHDERNAQRQRWSYIYKPEDIEALIDSLNPLGIRESKLRDELQTLRTLIEQHVSECPEEMISLEGDKKRKQFRQNMQLETQRKYSKANFGLSEHTDLNEVMHLHLIDRIMQFERDIFTGDLGRLKVKDMAKWRDDLLKGEYDAQGKLQWGSGGSGVREAGEEVASENGSVDGVEEDSIHVQNAPYNDPGKYLGPTLEIDSEDSADDDVPLMESEQLQSQVRSLASAMLQVEQAIEWRFFKEPFGVSRELTMDKIEVMQQRGQARLSQWEISLMESTSYSQVFLHLNILHDCIMWARSTNRSLCYVCRRGSDPDKMLLCDQCNGGTHMFCMKPKMRTVPEGNWYCNRCVKNLGMKNARPEDQKKRPTRNQRKFNVEEEVEEEEEEGEEEEEEEEVEQDSDEDEADDASEVSSRGKAKGRRRSGRRLRSKEIEMVLNDDADAQSDEDAVASEAEDVDIDAEESAEDDDEEEEIDNDKETGGQEDRVCRVCWHDDVEIQCARCRMEYHLECIKVRCVPIGDYICYKCKKERQPRVRPRQSNGDADDDDKEEPRAKRARNSLRISLQQGDDKAITKQGNNNNNNDASKNKNSRRSGRRTNEALPLNSAMLYDLLEQIMKHKLAWPFLRPVLLSEVPDYHKIVKSPMDLAKIKSRLNMGAYQLNEELLSDLQLVFHNCDLYNEEGNEIYDAGSELERFVIERCNDLHLPFKPSDMNAEADC